MIEKLKVDFQNNSFRSFIILFFHRICNYFYKKKYNRLAKFFNLIFQIIKIFLGIQSQISYKATIGKNIRLPHIGFGVIISAKAKIGDNCTIYHLVTIGINENKCNKDMRYCVEVGDNCYISTGAKIISSKVFSDSIIGPNAVVFKDIPSKSLILNGVIIK